MDLTQQSPTVLSICPGIGGLERGLERVFRSVRTCAYVEIEAFIVENLLTSMEAGVLAPAPVWTNLKTFRPDPFRGIIDILLGGYPCQPFSLAGNRLGTEDPRHLWPYIERIIEVIRPRACFFENVAAHLTLGYREVKQSLEGMGYTVTEGIYTAEEIGAPHRRERLFILAKLDNSKRKGLEGLTGYGNRTEGWSVKDGPTTTASVSPELADAYGGRLDDGTRHGHTTSERERGTCERNERSTFWRKISRRSSEVADACNDGRPRSENGQGSDAREGGSQTGSNEFQQSSRCSDKGTFIGFPAGQGHYQHDFEEPRTFESGLEYTAHGYNFTEDLHRAIGNSVVEQTAELAFRDLLRKHFK